MKKFLLSGICIVIGLCCGVAYIVIDARVLPIFTILYRFKMFFSRECRP